MCTASSSHASSTVHAVFNTTEREKGGDRRTIKLTLIYCCTCHLEDQRGKGKERERGVAVHSIQIAQVFPPTPLSLLGSVLSISMSAPTSFESGEAFLYHTSFGTHQECVTRSLLFPSLPSSSPWAPLRCLLRQASLMGTFGSLE